MTAPARTEDVDRATLAALHAGLLRRPMPESVARLITQLGVVARDPGLRARVEAAGDARGAVSSMSEDWVEVVPPRAQVATALDLFVAWLADNPLPEPITPEDADPARLRIFADHLSRALHKEAHANSFKNDRRPRAERAGDVLWRGHRAYNKRFRFLTRFEEKLETYARERRLLAARLLGKAGLVGDIGLDAFVAAPRSAAFVAYYAARKGRRSVFTNEAQSRPFDAVAEALLDRCFADPDTDWGLIARVYPAPAVLARLDGAAKAALLGLWLAGLVALAGDLERVWRDSAIDLDTMIVRRGNDSTTWNLLAQAWNNARTAWMALLADAGQDGLLTEVCPGKVMRLMAADVAAWHRASGGGIHPDTQVWAALPKPWQVLRGEVPCPASRVAEACRAAGLDPAKSGWIEGRVATEAVPFDPTPELVHGVQVASPELALLLRNARVFSGRPVRAPQPSLLARLKRLWGA